MPQFNWMDFAFILLLTIGMAVGYTQGLLRQIIALAALYLGAILAAQYFRFLSGGFKTLLPTTPGTILNAIAFFLITFAVMLLLNYLGRDAFNLKLNLGSWPNHLGGMVIGLMMTWIILTLAANILSFTTGLQWDTRAWDTETWKYAETIRQTVHDGLGGSLLVDSSKSTFPMILSAIKPWLPAAMPELFNL